MQKGWNIQPDLTAIITAIGLYNLEAKQAASKTVFNTLYVAHPVEKGFNNQDRVKAKRAGINNPFQELRDAVDSKYAMHSNATGPLRLNHLCA
ncbi:MAG: hypothetical protein ABIX01_11150 [Chitinophagaceae bacterium]